MRKLKLPFYESKVLINLYNRQLQNIQKSMGALDEDLQFDYEAELDEIKKLNDRFRSFSVAEAVRGESQSDEHPDKMVLPQASPRRMPQGP